MLNKLYILLIIFFAGCKVLSPKVPKSDVELCKSDLIAIDENLNFVLNDCVDIDLLTKGNGRFGEYTFFTVDCEDKPDRFGFISSISFDISDKVKRTTKDINIVLMQVGLDMDVEFHNFCQRKLDDIFRCNKELSAISDSFSQLSEIKNFSLEYNGVLFELTYEDKNLIILSIKEI